MRTIPRLTALFGSRMRAWISPGEQLLTYSSRHSASVPRESQKRAGIVQLHFQPLALHYCPMHLLAQTAENQDSWAPVVMLLIIAIGFAVVNVVASILIGPSRTGPGKETTYESGMVPIGDTRKRFNVRFYIVAMIFLVFDVEIVFLYPWATIFAPAARNSTQQGRAFGAMLLVEMGIFVAILLLAYLYAWGKGVFRWD